MGSHFSNTDFSNEATSEQTMTKRHQHSVWFWWSSFPPLCLRHLIHKMIWLDMMVSRVPWIIIFHHLRPFLFRFSVGSRCNQSPVAFKSLLTVFFIDKLFCYMVQWKHNYSILVWLDIAANLCDVLVIYSLFSIITRFKVWVRRKDSLYTPNEVLEWYWEKKYLVGIQENGIYALTLLPVCCFTLDKSLPFSRLS